MPLKKTKSICANKGMHFRQGGGFTTASGKSSYRKSTCVKKQGYTVASMKAYLKSRGISGYSKMKKAELQAKIHNLK